MDKPLLSATRQIYFRRRTQLCCIHREKEGGLPRLRLEASPLCKEGATQKMRNKLFIKDWSPEWVLLALLFAGIVGYLCWAVLPVIVQHLLIRLLINACLPLAILALVFNFVKTHTKEQESIQRNWQRFADQANMTFQLHPWRSGWRIFEGQQFCECAVKGVYQQRALTVERHKIYLGRHTFYVTQGTISLQNPGKVNFRIERRGLSSFFTNVLSPSNATVRQRELDTRFLFAGQPASLVTQSLQNQQIEKLLLDSLWLSGSTIVGAMFSVEGESLHFRAPSCHTLDELRELLNKVYTLAALLEQEIAVAVHKVDQSSV